MAILDEKISELTSLTVADSADLIPIVDVDQVETKNIRKDRLFASPGPIGAVNASTAVFTSLFLSSGTTTVTGILDEDNMISDSNTDLATQQSIKAYVDSAVGPLTTIHNNLNGLEGGDSTNRYHLTLAEYNGLTDGGSTDLHSHSVAHNNTTGLQGGSIPLDEYYHLDAQLYNQISSDATTVIFSDAIQISTGTRIDEFSTDGTLVGNSDTAIPTEQAVKTYVDAQITARDQHNELLDIQGGDGTNYYHLDLQTWSQISSDATSVIFSGDVYCDDLYVSSSTIFLGNTPLTESTTNGGLNITGDLVASRHMALGNTTIDFPGFPTYGVLLHMLETFDSGITGAGQGINLFVDNLANNAATITTGIAATAQIGTATAHATIQGGSFFANVTPNSATVTEVLGLSGRGSGAGDNSTITNMIGGRFDTNTSFGAIGVSVTDMIAVKAQILSTGSGELNITNGYGALIKTPGYTSTGTTTNLYGLYVEDQSGVGFANDYNIYSAGASSLNKFEGYLELGIGPAVNEISNDPTLSGDSTSVLVTEQAIKSYVDSQIAAEVITGQETLISGDTTATVVFASAEADTNYSISYSLVNTVDSPPSIYGSIVTEKTVNGFEILFSGALDSANYTLDWTITR